jgi:hypothetical protein
MSTILSFFKKISQCVEGLIRRKEILNFMEKKYVDHGNSINTCESCALIEELKDLIICNRDKGIPPRCFYPDKFRGIKKETGEGVKGIVVIGLNPGSSDKDEQEANCPEGSPITWTEEHKNWTNKWETESNGESRMTKIPFYNRIQKFLNELNKQEYFNLNEVVWTEVFKCELNVELKKEIDVPVIYFEKYWRKKIISLCFDLPMDEVEEFVNYYGQSIKTIENSPLEEEKYEVYFPKGDTCEKKLPLLLQDIYAIWRDEKKNQKKRAYSINHFLKNKFLKDFELTKIQPSENGYLFNNPSSLDIECFNILQGDDEIPFKDILLTNPHENQFEINFKEYFKRFNYILKRKKYENKKDSYWHIKIEVDPENNNRVDNKTLILGIIKCPLLLNSNGNNVGQKNIGKYVDVATHCSGKFLHKELNQIIPNEYPVLCIGKEAFQYVRVIAPNRLVIGMPHSSGSYGGAYRIYYDVAYEEKRTKIFEWISKDPLNNEKELNSKYFS